MRAPRWLWPLLLIAFAAAYFFLRLPSPMANPFHPDQVVNGNLAHALLHGTVMPAWAYQFPFHAHGSLLVAPVVAAVFALWGEYNLWLNLILVAISTLTALGWVVFADRFGSRRLAVCVAIVFAAGTPFWNYMSTYLWAGHTESCLLSILQVLLLAALVRRDARWPWFVALGIVAGLSTFFSLHNVFTVGVAVVYLALAHDRRGFAKSAASYALGLTAGFAPSVWLQFKTAARFSYYTASPRAQTTHGALDWLHQHAVVKTGELFGVVLPRLPDYESSTFNVVYMLLIVVGLAIAAYTLAASRQGGQPRARRFPLETILLLFAGVYLVLYAASGMSVFEPANVAFYRYLMPVLPALMVALAVPFARAGKIGAVALAVLAVASVAFGWRHPPSDWSRLIAEGWQQRHARKGYDLDTIYRQNAPHYIATLPSESRAHRYAKLLNDVSENGRPPACEGFGTWLAREEDDTGKTAVAGLDPACVRRAAAGFADEHTRIEALREDQPDWDAVSAWTAATGIAPRETIRVHLARGVGAGVAYLMNAPSGILAFDKAIRGAAVDPHAPALMDNALLRVRVRDAFEAVDAELRPAFLEGWARGLAEEAAFGVDFEQLFARDLGPVDNWRQHFARGAAGGIARRFVRYYYAVPYSDMRNALERYEAPASSPWRGMVEHQLRSALARMHLSLIAVGGDPGKPAFFELAPLEDPR